MDNNEPLVSCLCVTENRPAFMPWLLWNYGRQTWSRRELIIVDSSDQPFASDQPDVRIIPTAPGTGVAAKRNLALEAARGEIVAWFDDDDWQRPDKLAVLVEALSGGAPYAGANSGWFVNLFQPGCAPYQIPQKEIVFNGAGFRRTAVTGIRFPEAVRQASDTRWMRQVANRYPGQAVRLERNDLFFWLCHQDNLSNPAPRRRFSQPLTALQDVIGAAAWEGTDEALSALRERLKAGPVAATARVGRENEAPRRDSLLTEQPIARITAVDPAVSVMIKATVQDTPYLDVMTRHMIAQAGYPFTERVIVVDRPASFSGKYRDRPQATEEALEQVLAWLLADGVIDRVCPVDTTSATVTETAVRYFASGPPPPTHAVTGGPIYATLFGLEAMANDLVLQMDADIFFHSEAEGWLRPALDCLLADPALWLMMAHPGPPAGPPGQSLQGLNASRASWDPRMSIWRFQTATTRYFLCDRRRLRGRLHVVPLRGGCAPLENCLSQAMQTYGGRRGNLGQPGQWHLHAWYHGDPFPQWASKLVQAVSAGQIPAIQRGQYDLRLDLPPQRQAWQTLLATFDGGNGCAPPAASKPPPRERLRERRVKPVELKRQTAAPIAVIIPLRDRAGQRLRRALYSLAWQSTGRPAQIFVVSHGSQPAVNEELAAICESAGACLLTFGRPSQAWNKCLALNVGIRQTGADIPFLMTLDADMILAPNFLAVTLDFLQRQPDTLILCRSADLPQTAMLPDEPEQLLDAFASLQRQAQLRGRSGCGGIQASRRQFFFDVHGYDEDLAWWGAMDGDMVNRAKLAGLEVEWLEQYTAMLHQWHPRKHLNLVDAHEITAARAAWHRNHELVRQRAGTLVRNPAGWGGRAGVIM
jgi:glycosyltransferase involved in cell wall biosynthesis